MKYYSVGDSRRLWVAIHLAIAAFVLANLAGYLNPYLPDWMEIEDDGLGIRGASIAVVGMLLFAINRWIWRWPLINRFWIGIPDLNGTWIGTLNRVQYPDLAEESALPVILHIRQEWLRMSFVLENTVEGSLSKPTRSDSTSISIEGSWEEGFDLIQTFEFSQGFGVSTLRLNPEVGGDRLSGDYVSSVPRTGTMILRKITNGEPLHHGVIRILKSYDGEEYLGIAVDYSKIKNQEKRFSRLMTQDQYSTLVQNREKRDGHTHHLTILAPFEFAQLTSEQRKSITDELVAYSIVGLGRVSREAEAWFVIVHSPHAQFIRTKLGLPKKDFHVTLGFNPHDVHDHPKDESTLIE